MTPFPGSPLPLYFGLLDRGRRRRHGSPENAGPETTGAVLGRKNTSSEQSSPAQYGRC